MNRVLWCGLARQIHVAHLHLWYCVRWHSLRYTLTAVTKSTDVVLDVTPKIHRHLVTSSIARSASRWYLIYSEADEVFRPAGATGCTNGGEIWHGGGTEGSLLRTKFHPHRCNNKGVGPKKLKFLHRFDQNVEYKRPAGTYPLRDFHKICRVCTSFQDALGVKIWLDLLKRLWSYGGFKLRVSGFPQIFSAP